MQTVNEFLIFLCLCGQLPLYQLNCLYPNPQVFSLLPFQFSPPSCCGGNELCEAELPTLFKLQQTIKITGITKQNLVGGLKTQEKFVLSELQVSIEVKTPVSSSLDTQITANFLS